MSETRVFRIADHSDVVVKGLHRIDLQECGDVVAQQIVVDESWNMIIQGIWTPHPSRPDIEPGFEQDPAGTGIAPRHIELWVTFLNTDTFDATEATLEELLTAPWDTFEFTHIEYPELEIVASDASLDESWGIGYAGVDGEVIPVSWVYNNHATDDLANYKPATEGDVFIDSGGQAYILRRGRWVDPAQIGVEVDGDNIADWATHDDPQAKLIKNK